MPGDLLARSTDITRDALRHVDLLVVLPRTAADGIVPGADEHAGLRDAMNDALLDLLGDDDVVDGNLTVVEITGDRHERLAALEAASGAARLGGAPEGPSILH